MKCPAEFIWAQYVDDELPEKEASELTAHIASCAACRKLADALKQENQLLVQSLQGVERWEQEPAFAKQEIANSEKVIGVAAIVIGAAVLLRAGVGLVLNLEGPSVLDWLSPLSVSGQLNWLANAIFYILGEGRSMMASLISRISFIVLGCLVAGALIMIMRRIKGFMAIVSLAAILFAFVVPGHAMEVRRAGKGLGTITVPSNETINDTLVAVADTVDISGTVTGDLIAFARRVTIRGTVHGNVFGFGKNVEVAGNVNGSVFGFGQNIQASGIIGHNLWGFGQDLRVTSACQLQENASLFGSDMTVEGDIGRDLTTMGGTVDVISKIERDFLFRGGMLTLRAPATIGRNLSATSRATKNIQIDSGVEIHGNKKIEIENPKQSKYRTTGFYFGQLLRIVAAFIMGLLLFWVFPNAARPPFTTGMGLLKSGGVGFLAAVAIPIAALILAITLVGIPIALASLALWLLGLYLAKIMIAKSIGNAFFGAQAGMFSSALGLFIGTVVVVVAVNLPYIGSILNILLMLIGLGGLVLTVYSGWRRETAPAGEAII
jgi:hypothetical protein